MRIVTCRRLFSQTARTSNKVIGFIGLGQMGHHMCSNLLRKTPDQTRLAIFDAQPKAIQLFIEKAQSLNAGFKDRIFLAKSAAQVAKESDIVVTMLPSSTHVKSVYLDEGEGSILSGLGKSTRGKLFIDSSTIDPETSKLVSKAIIASGNIALDAPVSGGVGGAEAGTLTFMVGSESSSHYDLAKPILEMMGKNVVACGGLGTGQIAKICNNMLLGISMLATAETMNLGMRLGMDPKVLSSIIASSSGRNWSLDTYNPVPGILPNVPSSRNYKGGFAIELMAKDMGLAAQAAAQSKSFDLLGSLSKSLYEMACKSQLQQSHEPVKGHDFSVVFKWIQEMENSPKK